MTCSPPGPRVLVVDDEPQIRTLLRVSLTGQGYRVDSAGSGQDALERVAGEAFDIVLLDLGLPDMDGLQVCRQIRQWSHVPVIVLTVREGEGDKIAALDQGADDYVTKPFSTGELLARMRATMRRSSGTPSEPVIRVGQLVVDAARRRVMVDDREIHLTPTEYELLRVLAQHAGRVVTHRQLLRGARGPAYEEETPLLRVHLVALRQKLAVPPNTPGYIATEPGVGYRLLD